MTSQEAANILHMSVRSLQRLVKHGRIKVTYLPGRTRAVPYYDEVEIEALRVSMCDRPEYPQKRTCAAKPHKQSFGFRAAPEVIEELADEGAKFNMSAGQYARYLVRLGTESGLQHHVDNLTHEVDLLKAQHACLDETINQLRADFCETIEIVLEVAGNMSGIEARTWVDENLRSR